MYRTIDYVSFIHVCCKTQTVGTTNNNNSIRYLQITVNKNSIEEINKFL